MIFLTYNDNYSGIYKSQVIDVCTFLQKNHKMKVKLVAFVSLRNYSVQKKLIKSDYPNSSVLPMFPKIRFWRMNAFLLFFMCLASRGKTIWARGPFAANLAFRMKTAGLINKVIFDARGAYQAELTEYDVVADDTVKNEIHSIEKKALQLSNAQLAVSQKLVEWWKTQYNFISEKYAIIPCTLSSHFDSSLAEEKEIERVRSSAGFKQDDIVLVYSGTSAGWQSFNLVDEYLYALFKKDKKYRLLFLSNETPKDSRLFKEFNDRIRTRWVKPDEVRDILLAADYGLLIRENSITNKVASPVKFAEYLSCGLQIIISEGIGDFTSFVKENNCGIEYSKENDLPAVPYQQKLRNNRLALQHFTKYSSEIKQEYAKLLAV